MLFTLTGDRAGESTPARFALFSPSLDKQQIYSSISDFYYFARRGGSFFFFFFICRVTEPPLEYVACGTVGVRLAGEAF